MSRYRMPMANPAQVIGAIHQARAQLAEEKNRQRRERLEEFGLILKENSLLIQHKRAQTEALRADTESQNLGISRTQANANLLNAQTAQAESQAKRKAFLVDQNRTTLNTFIGMQPAVRRALANKDKDIVDLFAAQIGQLSEGTLMEGDSQKDGESNEEYLMRWDKGMDVEKAVLNAIGDPDEERLELDKEERDQLFDIFISNAMRPGIENPFIGSQMGGKTVKDIFNPKSNLKNLWQETLFGKGKTGVSTLNLSSERETEQEAARFAHLSNLTMNNPHWQSFKVGIEKIMLQSQRDGRPLGVSMAAEDFMRGLRADRKTMADRTISGLRNAAEFRRLTRDGPPKPWDGIGR